MIKQTIERLSYWLGFFVREFSYLLKGLWDYRRTGLTPERSHYSLVNLFTVTRGLTNELLHRVFRLRHPIVKIKSPKGCLGSLDAREIQDWVGRIRKDGYFVFPQRLSGTAVQSLLQFSKENSTFLQGTKEAITSQVYYDPREPKADRYHYYEEDLVKAPVVQELMADESFLAVAQSYLGCAPILDLVVMWWSTTYSPGPTSEAAQLFHFDMDRVKWLKFFIYLTDVTVETGPHCFVRGSHRAFRQPRALLKKGYARITDDELKHWYPEEDLVSLDGPAGTIMAVDTRGFHKGQHLLAGHRLILQLEYTDSLFGAQYRRLPLSLEHGGSLDKIYHQSPRLLSKFDLVR